MIALCSKCESPRITELSFRQQKFIFMLSSRCILSDIFIHLFILIFYSNHIPSSYIPSGASISCSSSLAELWFFMCLTPPPSLPSLSVARVRAVCVVGGGGVVRSSSAVTLLSMADSQTSSLDKLNSYLSLNCPSSLNPFLPPADNDPCDNLSVSFDSIFYDLPSYINRFKNSNQLVMASLKVNSPSFNPF